MQPRKIHWRSTLTSGIGALLAIGGAVLAISWDDIFYAILAKQLQLTPTSKTYDVWKETPIPIYLDVYFFNWTNPHDFLNTSTKPAFVQMGPYRFLETKKKVDVTFHENNNTVSYRQKRHWYHVEEPGYGSLDDKVTTLNVVTASAVYSSRNWGYLRQKAVSMGLAMFHETIDITKTVRQLLFEGYEDPLLDLANSLPQSTTGDVPPVDKFGWFYKRNGSSETDGYINMATGVGDISMLGKVKAWNNASSTKFYSGRCGNVSGAAGELYPPKLSKEDGVSLFSPDLCRSIHFDFDEVINVSGVPAYKYLGNSNVMDNGTVYEPNKCYCSGDCQPSGLLNVSICRHGSPAFISFPHFYLADPYYVDAVDGLSPNKENHSFFLALEPTSGIPVDVAARLQLNILVQPSEHVVLFQKVPRVFMPILWFEQRVTLSGTFASDVRQLLLVPLIGNIAALAIFVIGVIILLWNPVKVNVVACLNKNKNKAAKQEAAETVQLKETETRVQDNLEKINEDSENDSENEAKKPLNSAKSDDQRLNLC